MELLLGSYVREHASRLGRLTGFELEPATRVLRRLIISPDGGSASPSVTRPISAIAHVHDGGEVELRTFGDDGPPVDGSARIALNDATRLRDRSRDVGPLIGVEVDPADRSILSVFARPHWWSRRAEWPAAGLDFSIAGEIRVSSSSNRAA